MRFELTKPRSRSPTPPIPVHINRMPHELGRDDVIVQDKREVEIATRARMRQIAVFDPEATGRKPPI